MKKLLSIIALCGFLATASSAWSYTIDLDDVITSVGLEDTFLGSAQISPSEASEITWVSGWFAPGTQITINKIEEDTTGYQPEDWYGVIGEALWALPLTTNPEYFLLKVGVGNSGKDTHYLFQNNGLLDWAVISPFGTDLYDFEIDAVSHVSQFNGDGGTPVPEPGTMLLLGAGFLGLAIYGKRRRNV